MAIKERCKRVITNMGSGIRNIRNIFCTYTVYFQGFLQTHWPVQGVLSNHTAPAGAIRSTMCFKKVLNSFSTLFQGNERDIFDKPLTRGHQSWWWTVRHRSRTLCCHLVSPHTPRSWSLSHSLRWLKLALLYQKRNQGLEKCHFPKGWSTMQVELRDQLRTETRFSLASEMAL